MSESLLSVGIDIGTSTTQLIPSRLTLANRGQPLLGAPHRHRGSQVLLPQRDSLHTLLSSDTVIHAEGARTHRGGGVPQIRPLRRSRWTPGR